MRVTVPFFVDGRVVKAVIGTQIDDATTGLEQFGDDGHRGHVRQGREDEPGPLGNLRGGQVFTRQIEPARKRGVDRLDRRRAFLAAAKGGDFGLGMIEQQLDEFQGRIACRPDNRDLNHLAKDLVFEGKPRLVSARTLHEAAGR